MPCVKQVTVVFVMQLTPAISNLDFSNTFMCEKLFFHFILHTYLMIFGEDLVIALLSFPFYRIIFSAHLIWRYRESTVNSLKIDDEFSSLTSHKMKPEELLVHYLIFQSSVLTFIL